MSEGVDEGVWHEMGVGGEGIVGGGRRWGIWIDTPAHDGRSTLHPSPSRLKPEPASKQQQRAVISGQAWELLARITASPHQRAHTAHKRGLVIPSRRAVSP